MATSTDTPDHGWILHSRDFRNSSLILECLTRDRGRCAVVARAGRRNTLLQPFRPLALYLGGRGEMYSLKQAEADGPPIRLSGRQLFCGMYLNEILLRLLHRDDPHPQLLPSYAETLIRLEREPVEDSDVLLRRFEMHLLDSLGYGFPLDRDASGVMVEADKRYRLEAEQGLVTTAEGWPGSALLAMAAGDWTPDARLVGKQLMRQALRPHLGDRELKSRRLFRQRPGQDEGP